MTWPQAGARSVLFFLYFVVATVWLPDVVIRLDAVVDAPSAVRDGVVSLIWGAGFFAGAWYLRRGQRSGVV